MIRPGPFPDEFALKLVPDDAPLEGRILDLEGRPVAGAEVALASLIEPGRGVEAFFAAVRNDSELSAWLPGENPSWFGPLPGQPYPVRTGPDGQFRLSGLGRDRLVVVDVRGPSIANQNFHAFTRTMEPVVGPRSNRPQPHPEPPLTIRGARSDFAATPTRPIRGVVRDRATGTPLAGVEVGLLPARGQNALLKLRDATTDAEGHFTLLGHPKGKPCEIVAVPPAGSPHLAFGVALPDAPGLEPIEAEIKLARGIAFLVRPRDREDGKLVEATVEYYPLNPNLHVVELTGLVSLGDATSRAARQPDGSYRGVMLPGPGAICVSGDQEKYLRTHVDPWPFFQPGAGPRDQERQEYGDATHIEVQDGEGSWLLPNDQFHDIVLVNPKPEAPPFDADATLTRGSSVNLTILGTDGNPLVGARAFGADGGMAWSEPIADPRVEVVRVDPFHPRKVVVRHDGLKLVGQVIVPAPAPAPADLAQPATIRLQPWATVSGRLVDAQGKPRPGLRLLPSGDQAEGEVEGSFTGWSQTDPDGRFRMEAFVPGARYQVRVMTDGIIMDVDQLIEPTTFRPGEDRDLGDVQVLADRPRAMNLPAPAPR